MDSCISMSLIDHSQPMNSPQGPQSKDSLDTEKGEQFVLFVSVVFLYITGRVYYMDCVKFYMSHLLTKFLFTKNQMRAMSTILNSMIFFSMSY